MSRAVLLAFCVLACMGQARAASSKGLLILLRALAYDRSFSERVTDGALDIGVVFASTDPTGVRCNEEVMASRAELEALKLQGASLKLTSLDVKPVPVHTVDEAGPTPLERVLAYDLLYVCPGEQAAPVLKAAKEAGRITAVETMDMVKEGATLGIVDRAGVPVLVVNLRVSRAVGAEFPAQLLNVATVIR